MKGLCIILRTFLFVIKVRLLKNICYQNLICVPIIDNEEANFGSRLTMQLEHEQIQINSTVRIVTQSNLIKVNIVNRLKNHSEQFYIATVNARSIKN